MAGHVPLDSHTDIRELHWTVNQSRWPPVPACCSISPIMPNVSSQGAGAQKLPYIRLNHLWWAAGVLCWHCLGYHWVISCDWLECLGDIALYCMWYSEAMVASLYACHDGPGGHFKSSFFHCNSSSMDISSCCHLNSKIELITTKFRMWQDSFIQNFVAMWWPRTELQ